MQLYSCKSLYLRTDNLMAAKLKEIANSSLSRHVGTIHCLTMFMWCRFQDSVSSHSPFHFKAKYHKSAKHDQATIYVQSYNSLANYCNRVRFVSQIFTCLYFEISVVRLRSIFCCCYCWLFGLVG